MKASFAEWRRRYGAGLCILLLIVVATVLLVLFAGTAGCGSVKVSANATQIYTWHDLDAIRNNKQGSLIVGHYILMNDLDRNTPGYEELAGPSANDGQGWAPIGGDLIGDETQVMFLGLFEGQGYSVKDLRINRPGKDRVGLFGQLGIAGVVRNVGVVNADVTASFMVGALVGGNWGSVLNCYSSGNVSGTRSVGGLVAQNSYILRDSCSAATVTGAWMVGGLVGNNNVISGTKGQIRDCYATGNVIGDSGVGGLVGYNSEGATITSSYATGNVIGDTDVGGLVGYNKEGATITNSYAVGSVSAFQYVGGLAGDNSGDVIECYSTGEVGGHSYLGGLVGYNHRGATITDSYAAGNVTGYSYVGGLVGANDGPVSNCYSAAVVSAATQWVGGLAALNWDVVSNSFWDTETSGQPTSAGGEGRTTAEMKDIATFSDTGWNIVAVAPGGRNKADSWNIVNGVTYPLLSWQPA